MEKNFALYGWKDYNPNDITAEDEFLGFFETYEEACAEGQKLVKEKKISCFDIYN